jgi:hypothetical protein
MCVGFGQALSARRALHSRRISVGPAVRGVTHFWSFPSAPVAGTVCRPPQPCQRANTLPMVRLSPYFRVQALPPAQRKHAQLNKKGNDFRDEERSAAVYHCDASGRVPHQKGSEAFMSYGPRSNRELLLHYGCASGPGTAGATLQRAVMGRAALHALLLTRCSLTGLRCWTTCTNASRCRFDCTLKTQPRQHEIFR